MLNGVGRQSLSTITSEVKKRLPKGNGFSAKDKRGVAKNRGGPASAADWDRNGMCDYRGLTDEMGHEGGHAIAL